jgi:hypothetical protein
MHRVNIKLFVTELNLHGRYIHVILNEDVFII